MHVKVRLAGLTLAATMLVAFAIVPAVSAAPTHAANAHSHRPPVTMTATYTNAPITDPTTGTQAGTFSGVAQITHVDVVGGQLVGSGTVTGVATETNGTTVPVSQTFTDIPIDPPASCSILNLTLGPIYLNLLGLVVQTNTIHLTISAVPGPGNLLGNLLCDVANLLNGSGGGLTAAIQNLLNQINALLAGL